MGEEYRVTILPDSFWAHNLGRLLIGLGRDIRAGWPEFRRHPTRSLHRLYRAATVSKPRPGEYQPTLLLIPRWSQRLAREVAALRGRIPVYRRLWRRDGWRAFAWRGRRRRRAWAQRGTWAYVAAGLLVFLLVAGLLWLQRNSLTGAPRLVVGLLTVLGGVSLVGYYFNWMSRGRSVVVQGGQPSDLHHVMASFLLPLAFLSLFVSAAFGYAILDIILRPAPDHRKRRHKQISEMLTYLPAPTPAPFQEPDFAHDADIISPVSANEDPTPPVVKAPPKKPAVKNKVRRELIQRIDEAPLAPPSVVSVRRPPGVFTIGPENSDVPTLRADPNIAGATDGGVTGGGQGIGRGAGIGSNGNGTDNSVPAANGVGTGTGLGPPPPRGGIGSGEPLPGNTAGNPTQSPVSKKGDPNAKPPEDYERVFTAREVDTPIAILLRPKPLYTDEARKNQASGVVRLRVVLYPNGTVNNVQVLAGLPYGLTEKAIEAVKQLKFSPALKDGRQVKQITTIEFNFSIY